MADAGWRLEQHIGTIMQVMVVGLLGWSLLTSVQMKADLGVLQAQVQSMQATISQGTSDRYRGEDARRDFAAVYHQLSLFDRRLEKVENHVHQK